MKLPAPNRIAVYLTAGAGLATAVAVPLAELDTSSVVGVVGGLAAIATVVHKFLEGWQRHEARVEARAIEPVDMAVLEALETATLPAPTPPRPTDPRP